MLHLTTAAVNDAEAATLKEQPQVPSNLIDVAGRRRTGRQEMFERGCLFSVPIQGPFFADVVSILCRCIFADVVSIFEYLNSNKYRVVYSIGDEHVYRTLVCAVIETNIKKGIICKVDQRKVN